jgi:glucose/mannose-6-phosphate isomerase
VTSGERAIDLDDAAALGRADPGGMLAMVAGLPAQLERAATVRDAALAAGGTPARSRSVLVCGMGGSAIGAEVAAVWAAAHGVRVTVHRSYGLPAWLDDATLLVFSSYSGNTEETLSAFDAAARFGAARRCIATGGTLAARARAAGAPLVLLPPGLQPRAALGHSLVALTAHLHAAGLVPDPVPDLERAAAHLRRLLARWEPASGGAHNAAKQLARRWHGRLPVVWTGSGATQPVGVRWKGQIHENAKSFATVSVFPELDHNEIMAWTALPELRKESVLTLVRDRDDGDAIARRMQVTAEILSPRVGAIEWVDTEGDSVLERVLSAAWLGDWASVYLAFLYGVDPTPVGEIETLKARLAAAPRA